MLSDKREGQMGGEKSVLGGHDKEIGKGRKPWKLEKQQEGGRTHKTEEPGSCKVSIAADDDDDDGGHAEKKKVEPGLLQQPGRASKTQP